MRCAPTARCCVYRKLRLPDYSRSCDSWPNTTFEVTVLTCSEVAHGVETGQFHIGLLLQPMLDARPSLVTDRIVIAPDIQLIFSLAQSPACLHGPRGW
jgi:hypothetical protein